MTTVQRSRSSRAAAPGIRAGARRAPSLARGTWRHSRARFQPEPGGGPGGGRRVEQATRILLVDDERAIRTICRVNLESDGMEVVEAADGAQALELVRAESPSLVLLDVMMPTVDGWTAAESLLVDPETKDIPVVFLSARAAPEDRLRAQKLGAVGYVVKPFDPVELAAIIRGILDRIDRGEREQLNRELSEQG
jgi:DNA-binding response OmpR family regulator